MLRFCAIATLAILTPLRGSAQATDTTALPRVVVTATRVESRLGSDVASTSVLSGDSLRARGIRDVAEALREVPGVAVVRSGSFGAQTSLFLRGGESDYVRVLIDGVAMNEPGGSVDLSSYTIENVDRIEIVRGPASVLYGSDAVAGVIQIFTRRADAPLLLDASAGSGTYGTRALDFSLGSSSSLVNVSLGGGGRWSEGIHDFNSEYDNRVLSARVATTSGAGFRASLSGRQWSGDYHYPTDGAGRVVDRNAFRRDSRSAVAFDARQRLGSRMDVGLLLSAMEGRPRTVDAADGSADTAGFYAYRSATSVRRRAADARMNVALASDLTATFGYEWQREAQRGRDSSNFDPAPNVFAAGRTTHAAYAQVVGQSGAFSYTVGGRYDDNDVFGSFRTARGGVAWRPGRGFTLRASAAAAFKAPTFLEQFNTAFTIGNPALSPERSRSIEAGIIQRLADNRAELGITLFRQRFRDMIQYSFVDVAMPNYFNVAAASADGVELEARGRVASNTQLGLTMTFLRTRVDDAGFDEGENATFVEGNRLLRRPSVSGALTGQTNLTPRLTADVRVLHVGSRDDRDFSGFPATPVILESYERIDAGLAYRLTAENPTITVFLRAENLFDSDYQEIRNFDAPGRVLSAGLRVTSRR